MKAAVQILAPSVPRKAKDGKVFLHECQCVVLGENVQVGVLKVSQRTAEAAGVLQEVQVGNEKVHVIPAGAYDLEYGLGIGWDDKELKGVLKSIIPAGKGPAVLANLNNANKEVKG